MPIIKRTLYTVAAIIALGIGLLGLVVPVIPGVLFLLLAVALLAGASRRVRARLHEVTAHASLPATLGGQRQSADPCTPAPRSAVTLCGSNRLAESLTPCSYRGSEHNAKI